MWRGRRPPEALDKFSPPSSPPTDRTTDRHGNALRLVAGGRRSYAAALPAVVLLTAEPRAVGCLAIRSCAHRSLKPARNETIA